MMARHASAIWPFFMFSPMLATPNEPVLCASTDRAAPYLSFYFFHIYYIITQVLFEVKVREIIPVCMIQLKRRSKDLENSCSATVVYETPSCPYYLKYLIAYEQLSHHISVNATILFNHLLLPLISRTSRAGTLYLLKQVSQTPRRQALLPSLLLH